MPDPNPRNPRATDAKGTENQGVDEPALQNNGVGVDFLKQQVAGQNARPTIAFSLEDWAKGSPMMLGFKPKPLPPVTEEQRKQAARIRPPQEWKSLINELKQRIQSGINQELPADVFFERPPTDFEIRLLTQKTVQLLHPGTRLPTQPFASRDFEPLADPDNGRLIGYFSSHAGADSLFCDIQGNIVIWGDIASPPSDVQLDDIIFIGGDLVRVSSKLIARGGAKLIGSLVRRIPKTILQRLRAAAGAVLLGTSRAAPIVGGELGARAAITAEQRAVGGAAEKLGSQAITRTTPSASAASVDALLGETAVGKVSSQGARMAPIQGAQQILLSRAQYLEALNHVFPSHYVNVVLGSLDEIGRDAARTAVKDPRFVQACRTRNWTLAGTLFHSAAAQAGRAMALNLPQGFRLRIELTVQAGAGGSRLDTLFFGPTGELIEVDWKTTGTSGLRIGARREMARHASQVVTNVGQGLTAQMSKSWVDYVRPHLPGVQWPR